MAAKAAEEALLAEIARLRRSSSIFSALMDDTGRALAILSPDRRIVAANDTLAAWFPHYPQAGPVPVCHAVLNPGRDAFCEDCPAPGCRTAESSQAARLTLASRAGHADFKVSCTPLHDEGKTLLGFLEVIETVGESAPAEKAMQQYMAQLEEKVHERTSELTASQQKLQKKIAELDAANRELKVNRDRLIRSEKLAAVGEMSATVAHGLRNPLVSIGGFARRLLKNQQPELNEKYLRIIVDEIDRLEVILTELLDFVRPRKLELKSVYLGSVVEDALKGFSAEFARRGIQVKTSLHPGIPALEIDVDQFRRVLQNLFHNSLDAMNEGGVLHIATSLEDGTAKISIADTGQGIKDEDIEKVFHPFYTSKPSSAGLGLAVCNQIIVIHGGHIKLQRRLPRGVVFDIYLPITRPEAHL